MLRVKERLKVAGTGFDMMKRIAAPMVGLLLTLFLMEFLVYPPGLLSVEEKKIVL